jgi:hypothetical protein
MTSYQMLVDSICSRLFRLWQDGCNQESWNEEDAKKIAKLIIRDVESFKMNQQSTKDA